MPIGESKDSGVSGAAKSVTSTLGNLTGGIARTAGGVVGAGGTGLSETFNETTGTKGADGLKSVTDGVDDGSKRAGKGVEDAGKWKS